MTVSNPIHKCKQGNCVPMIEDCKWYILKVTLECIFVVQWFECLIFNQWSEDSNLINAGDL